MCLYNLSFYRKACDDDHGQYCEQLFDPFLRVMYYLRGDIKWLNCK